MTHTEFLIAYYEAAIRVMETLPAVVGYQGCGWIDQRALDLTELRRRLAVMKQWRPGQRWQAKPHCKNEWEEENNPMWYWQFGDYGPAPEPPKPPGVVWIRPLGLLHGQTSDPFQVSHSTVKPDGPGWTRYTIAPEGGGV